MAQLTQAQVLEALRQVIDPELRRNIVELDMVREIRIEGNQIHVTIALTVPNCPLQDQISNQVGEVLDALADNLDIEVELTAMTEEEKKRLTQKLRGQQAQQADTASSPAANLNRVRSVIAVMSGKGGVGKSTVTALLAIALQRAGLRVGILDADITGASIPKLFGVHEHPFMSPLGILPPTTRTGIKLMSINLLLENETDAVIWRGPLITGAIQQFWTDVFWGDLDVLLIDMPPGTADAALTVMQQLPLNGVLLITSPQSLADMVVRKAAAMAQRLNTPMLGIVENMSYVQCPHCDARIELFGNHGSSQALAVALDTPLLDQVPLDPELVALADAGQIEDYAPMLIANTLQAAQKAIANAHPEWEKYERH